MSTRCNVVVGDHIFEHHYDGYPKGVGADLAYFLANINAGTLPFPPRDLDGIAECLRRGIHGRLGEKLGRDHEYEEFSGSMDNEVYFLYLIDGAERKFRLYCVDLRQYIRPFMEAGHMSYEHPLFKAELSPSELGVLFCQPKYEVPLPSVDVPLEERLYAYCGVLTYDQAKFCGFRPDTLGYGNSNDYTCITRVRNVKRPKRWRK